MVNNLLNLQTPAQKEAEAVKSAYGLENLGLSNLSTVYWNLPPEARCEEALFRGEGRLTSQGALAVDTGKHTAPSANDKFVVKESSTEVHIWWGEHNRPFSENKFSLVFQRMLGYLQGRNLFVQDCLVGADPNYRWPVRVVTELAWHSLFARNLFIRPQHPE